LIKEFLLECDLDLLVCAQDEESAS
jgi:hypothetical protein